MIFSRWRLFVFFLAAAGAAWLLYPSEYFVGLMRRQEADRREAIASFRNYLSEHPFHKQASLALAGVYESIGKPEEALGVLRELYRHRRGDIEVGFEHLELLERAGLLDEALAFRWRLYEDAKSRPTADRDRLEDVLYGAYQAAKLAQDQNGELLALEALLKVTAKPDNYLYDIESIYMERRDFARLIPLVRAQFTKNPADLDSRNVLIDVHVFKKDLPAALREIGQGLAAAPGERRLIERRVFIFELQKDYASALIDLKELVRRFPDDPGLRRHMAYDALQGGRWEEALAVYEDVIAGNPNDPEPWREVIYEAADKDRKALAAQWLERFIKRFPDDGQALEFLAGLYEERGEAARAAAVLAPYFSRFPEDRAVGARLASLYAAADRFEEARAIYEALIVAQPGDRKVWWDLIYGLSDRGRGAEASAWLERYLAAFPGEAKATELLVYEYQKMGRAADALKVLRSYMDRNPASREKAAELAALLADLGYVQEARDLAADWHRRHPEDSFWTLRLAQITAVMGDAREALGLYKEWLAAQGDRPEALREVGAQALFAGDARMARRLLERAREFDPENGDTLYYLAEAEYALGSKEPADRWARLALERLNPSKGLETLRKRLRLQGRLNWSPQAEDAYRALAAKPDSQDFTADWIELRLAHRLDASEPIALYRQLYPKREEAYRRFLFQNAFQKKDYAAAIASLEPWLDKTKGPRDLRDALGEAYWRAGRWKEAASLIDGAFKDGDQHLAEVKNELHERYDHTIAPDYRAQRLSGQSVTETGVRYHGYASPNVRVEGSAMEGSYEVTPESFKRNLKAYSARVGYEGRPFRLALLGSGSSGAVRDRWSPGFEAGLRPREDVSLEAGYRHQAVWRDVAQAVAAGALESEARLAAQGSFLPRLYASARYLYNHYQASDGSKAWRSRLEPELAYAFYDKPYLAAFYRFDLDRSDGDQAFLDQVPLIRRAQSSFVGLTFSHWALSRALRLSAHFANGADSGRRLEFFKGDLLVAGAGAAWTALPWLRVAADYEYSKQTTLGASGEMNSFSLRLEGHWFGGR